ncbi:MAG: hypothetical protein ABIT71_14275 [Vicinamibacteraceae bacterium]
MTLRPRFRPAGPTVRFALPLAALALATTVVGLDAQARQRKIYTSLVDKKGVPVTTVTAADVVVREDGVAREVLSVTPATDPMRVALLIDNSQSATQSIQFLRTGLSAFATRLTSAGHSVALITLGDRPTLQVDATTDLARLKSRGIDRLFAQPNSGMYLLEALVETSKGFLKNDTPRPVIVAVVTEGKEFSTTSADVAIRAIRDSGAQFYALVLTEGDRADQSDDEVRQRNVVLDRGTRENGGTRDTLLSNMAIKDRLDLLAGELLGQVAVTYASPDRLLPPEKITIAASREGLTARGVPVKVAKTPVPER